MIQPNPTVVGLRKSFGFGDRLGLATPGHVAACRKTDFIPIFAQQSIREMVRTKRTPDDVMEDARKGVMRTAYEGEWGADADHLKTEDDVRNTAAAGFTFFTFDPSDHVVNEADTMTPEELAGGEKALIGEGVFGSTELRDLYLGKRFDIDNGFTLTFDETSLLRAAVKYGRAVRHCARLGQVLREAKGDQSYEIEMSVDESEVPTTPLEHLFVAKELRRRGVEFISLAPRFIGDFEKGVDYRGDIKAFEKTIEQHVAIAAFCGPYKLSLHSGSDKFSVYPIFGRLCGEMLHVKTAGTSYLEALRVVVRTDKPFFKELADYCCGRFAQDKASYHLSTTQADIDRLAGMTGDSELERLFLDKYEGRQLMHVTYGSVLTLGENEHGEPYRDRLMAILEKHAEMHLDFIERHFDKHLSLLLEE